MDKHVAGVVQGEAPVTVPVSKTFLVIVGSLFTRFSSCH